MSSGPGARGRLQSSRKLAATSAAPAPPLGAAGSAAASLPALGTAAASSNGRPSEQKEATSATAASPAKPATTMPALRRSLSGASAQVASFSASLPTLTAPDPQVLLLTRALEESQGRVKQLQRERATLCDTLGQLCVSAGAAGQDAAARQAPTAAGDEALIAERLGLLATQLQLMKDSAQAGQEALAEVQEQHERAVVRVVVMQQEREALEQELQEMRHSAQQHNQAQQAFQVKVGLLEEQLASSADNSRRRMQEQLECFRNDSLAARTLQDKCTDLERQLDGAQRAHRTEAVQRSQLAEQVEQLREKLSKSTAKWTEQDRQLSDKSAALSELSERHQALQADRTALAQENAQLQEELATCQEQAQHAKNLASGAQAQYQAARQLQAALQDEAERLRSGLQQERQQKHQLKGALAEEQRVCANQRAALQGKSEELGSLCLKLDEYSCRVVAAEEALKGALQHVEREQQLLQQAEEAARHAQLESHSLRASLTDLTTAEARWKQGCEQAEKQLAAAEAARKAEEWKRRQLERTAGMSREHVRMLQATLAEQAQQLAEMAALREQVDGQQYQLEDLRGELHAATERIKASQAAADELATAKQQLEREVHKQEVVCRRLKEQCSEAKKALEAATQEAVAARAAAEDAGAQAARQRVEYAAAVDALREQHEHRKARNEKVERENRQQTRIIAQLQASGASLSARLEASQQHNAALLRYAVAHGAAYGRLAAHAVGLHQQFVRQLSGLLSLCRHLSLQVAAALEAADPLTTSEVGDHQLSSDGGSQAAVAAPTAESGSAAAVAAAVLCIENLQMELAVAVKLLELQGSGTEAQQLAAEPASIAQALQTDLAGVPADLLASPRLAFAPAAAAFAGSSAALPSATPLGPASQVTPSAAAGDPTQQPPSVLSTQVSEMETRLQRLVHASAEHAARAAAAVQLQQQEQAARQRAQDLSMELSSQLAASQADLAATKEQRDQLDSQSRRLAQDLRDAIYSLSQLHAQQQGQALSWAVRGLTSAGVQTQYCELWEAKLGGQGAFQGAEGVASCSSGDGSVLCAAVAESSVSTTASSDDGSDNGSGTQRSFGGCQEMIAGSVVGKLLPLPALQQLMKDIYRAKAQHDIAVARGTRPFQALAEFLPAYLAQQHGTEAAVLQQLRRQLQASVEAHAGVWEVCKFGLAAGILEEAACNISAPAGGMIVRPAGPTLGSADPVAAEKALVVLYNGSGGHCKSGRDMQHNAALSSLRRFCGASWHTAFQGSAARQPLPQPFSPAGRSRLLHGMLDEVLSLALRVPGVQSLMGWVLGGGVGGCLPQLDLGLRLAENQVPQLYLLAVESCRLLGLQTTPQLYIKSSGEAAAYYLLLPGSARLHGMNGSLAEEAPPATKATICSSSSIKQSSAESRRLEADGTLARGSSAPAEQQGDWQCALVLTSGLVDLLEPEELQAVMAGSLGFHAALTSPAAGASLSPEGSKEAEHLVQLCRSMPALATAGALCALCPEALAARLPQQMAPFFYSRVQPVLRRVLRYFSLYCDRTAAAAMGGWQPVAASIVKQAAGSTTLKGQLNLDAVLQQAHELDNATVALLPKTLLREGPATMAGAGASLPLLRVRELQMWAAAGVAGHSE